MDTRTGRTVDLIFTVLGVGLVLASAVVAFVVWFGVALSAASYCDHRGADCVEPDPFLILTPMVLGLIVEFGICIWGVAHGVRTQGQRWLWPYLGVFAFFIGLMLTASLA